MQFYKMYLNLAQVVGQKKMWQKQAHDTHCKMGEFQQSNEVCLCNSSRRGVE